MNEESEIINVLQKMGSAARSGNVNGIMSLFSSKTYAIEFGNLCDLKKVRKNCEEGYSQITSKFDYNFDVKHICASGKLAFVYGIERISGRNLKGPFKAEVFATYGFEKIEGNWLIVHQHLSNKEQ